MSRPKRIAVVGGGYAGMAAAVRLVQAGCTVQVFEAGPALGGRARRVNVPEGELDNGQHLLLGAYGTLLGLMREVGVDPAQVFLDAPLDLQVDPDFRLHCPDLPAPLHSLVGLLRAQGLSVSGKLALVRALLQAQLARWRTRPDWTVRDWLQARAQPADLIERFWRPLTVAALNTPPEIASAQVLLNVLRDSLGGPAFASHMLFPRVDFSALWPEPAGRYVERHGGKIQCGSMVRRIEPIAAGYQIDAAPDDAFDGVVLAVSPHRLQSVTANLPALADTAARLQQWPYQPIVTVYSQYDAVCQLSAPMLGRSTGVCQWIFDRNYTHATPGLIAVVISANGAHMQWSQAELAAQVATELGAAYGWPAPRWQRVISEKRATFACTPDLQRPPNATPYNTVWLAGDYTAGDYPATLEGAVRSGVAAAVGLMIELNKEQQA
ncbi:hydroxysqualene dehydroxylase HpnE [Amantichitinum ursilacus]|uniref:hydroxysqualene dehydroxylase HpnE n=1 Tax=Amantichitinum ursilacus TaxID=857265 RepID=UPI00128F683B|nr:hydroxysqualene dehydroxylase HpnE [Amantichitinum ursilacus]